MSKLSEIKKVLLRRYLGAGNEFVKKLGKSHYWAKGLSFKMSMST